MYADLQFPRSSNFGSMKRKGEVEDNININIKVDGNNIENSIHLKPTYDILNGAIELFP